MAFAQANTITLNYKDQTLNTVFKSIEQQTNYRIVYNSTKINSNKKVTIKINKGTIETVFKQLFQGSDISYVIKNNQVLLTDLKLENTKASTTQKEERLIKGKVISVKDNFPLAGATLLLKGKYAGAITNIDGEFTYLLKGNDIDNMALLVSFLGYNTKEVVIGNRNYFEIFLDENFSSLKEVVITSSYGTKKLKEELVGSISTLTSKDIAVDQASESIDKMIDGQIAGVLIENTSGIGGPVKINIRGQGSLTPIGNQVLGTSTQPLIIIDGVIIAEETGIDSSFLMEVVVLLKTYQIHWLKYLQKILKALPF